MAQSIDMTFRAREGPEHPWHQGRPGLVGGSQSDGGGISVDEITKSWDKESKELFETVHPAIKQKAVDSGLKKIHIVDTNAEMEMVAGKAYNPGAKIYASYDDQNGTLTMLRSEMTGEEAGGMVGRLHHEMAHAADKPGEDGKYIFSESKEWLEASGWEKGKGKKGSYKLTTTLDDNPINNYAKTAPWEDYAETFRVVAYGKKIDRRAMALASPKRYAYMKEKLSKDYGIEIEP